MKNISFHPIKEEEINLICKLPNSEEELYFMFPKASYPLTYDQLKEAVDLRSDSTVIEFNGELAGFANFYEAVPNDHCSLGNVVVNPNFRGCGVAKFLVDTMENIAKQKYNAKELHISCFNTNTPGILLYTKLGYKSTEIEQRTDYSGRKIAFIKFTKVLF